MEAELLAPAGSYESMTAAFAAGADAVYMGGKRFGARAYADNPDDGKVLQAIDYAHMRGKKLYLTVNTLLKDQELEELYDYLNAFYREGLDAVIVQDLGVLSYIRDVFPGMDIHASTQMGITGSGGAKLAKDLGASRVVTARELSLEEIRKIRGDVDIEIESFVHGALCFCYSGQCLLSSMIGGRSGNRGRCAQPCRLPYELLCDGKNCGKGKYLLSPKDICTLDLLPQILRSGVYSLKIEGRMKSPEYTAGVVRIYRRALDRLAEYGAEDYAVLEDEKKELLDLYNRGGFSQGYFKQQNGPQMMSAQRPNHFGVAAAETLPSKNGFLLRALLELHAGDVLEYREGEGAREFTLERDVKRGQKFQISGKSSVREKAVLYRMRNESLLRELHERYAVSEQPVKINGKLRLFAQKPVILELSCGKYRAQAEGNPPQAAKTSPVAAADIERQIKKTGGSGFVFDRLEIEMEDGLFLPVGELNRLRRAASDRLRDAMKRNFLRADGRRRPLKAPADPGREMMMSVSLEDPAGFDGLCGVREIGTLYLDCCAFLTAENFLEDSLRLTETAHRAGKRCMYIMPWVFRNRALAFYKREEVRRALALYDGVLLRNLEEYVFLRSAGYAGKLAADWNLYTFNTEAQALWRELGLSYDTVPVELNRREICRRSCRGSELIVYGYQPLMVSAQCQVKNASGCTEKPCVLHLKDRKNKVFAVKNNCLFCYNVLYNSTPLELYDNAQEIRAMGPRSIRLQFTTETASERIGMAEAYADAFLGSRRRERKVKDFTRGHFERGVE